MDKGGKYVVEGKFEFETQREAMDYARELLKDVVKVQRIKKVIEEEWEVKGKC